MLTPPRLKPGNTIGVIAPAGPVLDQEALHRGVKFLEAEGFKVRLGKNILGKRGYFSGTDRQRLDDLNGFLNDKEIRAVFAARGGYGCTRLLEEVDYRAFRMDPKIVVGFSDLTALLWALTVRTGVVTYHGPMVASNFGGTWSVPAHENFLQVMTQPPGSVTIRFEDWEPKPHVLQAGRSEGPLWGGCLSLVAALQGTAYSVPLSGAMFYWEDIREEPYRLDRMLQHLRLAARLEGIYAMLAGRLATCEAEHPDRSLTLEQVLRDHAAEPSCPLVVDFPFGHGVPQVTLPVGGTGILDTGEGFLRY